MVSVYTHTEAATYLAVVVTLAVMALLLIVAVTLLVGLLLKPRVEHRYSAGPNEHRLVNFTSITLQWNYSNVGKVPQLLHTVLVLVE